MPLSNGLFMFAKRQAHFFLSDDQPGGLKELKAAGLATIPETFIRQPMETFFVRFSIDPDVRSVFNQMALKDWTRGAGLMLLSGGIWNMVFFPSVFLFNNFLKKKGC